MAKHIASAVLAIGIFVTPITAHAAGLSTGQAESLIGVVRSAPGLPAAAFVNLITAFSHVTVNQATTLIALVQSAPDAPAGAFISLLISFTADTGDAPAVTVSPSVTVVPVPTKAKAPTCALNVKTTSGVVKTGLTGTGYYDGSGSGYVEVRPGEGVTVSWSSSNAEYAVGPGGGRDVANGQETYYPGGDKAYVWNFTGPGGSTSCGVMVEMLPSKGLACSLSAKPYMPAVGESTTLTWSSPGASYAMWQQDSPANILGLSVETLPASGSETIHIGGGKGVQTPTLLVYGASGSGSCSTDISIQ